MENTLAFGPFALCQKCQKCYFSLNYFPSHSQSRMMTSAYSIFCYYWIKVATMPRKRLREHLSAPSFISSVNPKQLGGTKRHRANVNLLGSQSSPYSFFIFMVPCNRYYIFPKINFTPLDPGNDRLQRAIFVL